ncbi:MAG: hypothetical protein FWF81_00110 [Defluviitaleaceae bacterium]|nr:hypothetical protein [Defluviitaleaceae bacterium]
MDIAIISLPMILTFLFIFSAPISLEKTNAKRIAKGKSALSEEEFQSKIKKERIIGAIILATCYVIAVVVSQLV